MQYKCTIWTIWWQVRDILIEQSDFVAYGATYADYRILNGACQHAGADPDLWRGRVKINWFGKVKQKVTASRK